MVEMGFDRQIRVFQERREWHSRLRAQQVQRHRNVNQRDAFEELQVIRGHCQNVKWKGRSGGNEMGEAAGPRY